MKNVTFETSYKFKKWRKRNRINNHKLLRRYPFLRAKDWHGNPIKGDDFTFLDDIPKGWVKLFGIQMCEDLRNSLLRTGDFRHYGVDQTDMRWVWEISSTIVYRRMGFCVLPGLLCKIPL